MYSDRRPNDAPIKHAIAATSAGCETVVTVIVFPVPTTVDTVAANPTTTAGVVENNGTQDA